MCVTGAIHGHRVIAAAMEFEFLGGSLGSGVGERTYSRARTGAIRKRNVKFIGVCMG